MNIIYRLEVKMLDITQGLKLIVVTFRFRLAAKRSYGGALKGPAIVMS